MTPSESVGPMLLEIQSRGLDATQSVLALWTAMAAELTSIIGDKGVGILIDRSVFIQSSNFPWLNSQAPNAVNSPQGIWPLGDVAVQVPEHAEAANQAVLTTFLEQLQAMIGQGLTQHMLAAALLKVHSAAFDNKGPPL
jgi:hypothetical protein